VAIAGILSGLDLQLRKTLAVFTVLHCESWGLFNPELKLNHRT